MLPDELADLLDDASSATDAATDEVVRAFIATHTGAERAGILAGWVNALTNKFAEGSRHNGSDGKETVPSNPDSPGGAYTAARTAKGQGVPISTISFGFHHLVRHTVRVCRHQWAADTGARGR